MRSLAFGVIGLAAVAILSGTAPSRADGLFVGVGGNSNGIFAGAAIGASPYGQGYATTYQVAPLPYVPAAAVRYNRPCSVTDGFRTVVIPCDSAAMYTVGATYAPVGYAPAAVGYPVYGDAAPRYGWRHHHRRHHYRHGLVRRLY